jgi:hypothetical protein
MHSYIIKSCHLKTKTNMKQFKVLMLAVAVTLTLALTVVAPLNAKAQDCTDCDMCAMTIGSERCHASAVSGSAYCKSHQPEPQSRLSNTEALIIVAEVAMAVI